MTVLVRTTLERARQDPSDDPNGLSPKRHRQMATRARAPRRDGRHGRTVGIVGVVIFVIGACLYFDNQNRPKVGIVGDSITAMSRSSIFDDLTPGYQLKMYAHPGATMYQLLPLIDVIDADNNPRPTDWIIEAGTNDMAWFENGDHGDLYWWWFLSKRPPLSLRPTVWCC